LNPLLEAGFVLERILEPIPTEQFKQADPKGYEKLSRQPGFLCIRAGSQYRLSNSSKKIQKATSSCPGNLGFCA